MATFFLSRNRFWVIVLMIAGAIPAIAQESKDSPPVMSSGEIPMYPLNALNAGIQGIVKIRVTADANSVSSVQTVSGAPMLVQAAKANIQTWHFSDPRQSTFVTTFLYEIEDSMSCERTNQSIELKMPTDVHVRAKMVSTCDPREPR